MKQGKYFAVGMLAAALTFGVISAGCDTGTNSGNFVPVTDITNVPVIALVNASLSLSGTVEPANATNTTITWTGDTVSNGVFTAPSAGDFMVTATIVNGASESSPYTENFIIKAYNDTNPITLGQGTWTRQVTQAETTYTVKMTITGNNWQISVIPSGGSETLEYKGIIVNVGATTYAVQTTHDHNGSAWYPKYHYEEGTYTLSNNNNTLTLVSPMNPDSAAAGTWTKQSS
jgi:hypothetical protein